MSINGLPNLSGEVASLINAGIFSLYEIDHDAARYALVTDKGIVYLVAKDGTVLSVFGGGATRLQWSTHTPVRLSDLPTGATPILNA